MRFLTVGSCPLRAASNFKSRTGFESLDDIELLFVGTVPGLVSVVMEVFVGADEEKEQTPATTTSVLGIFTNVGVLRSVLRQVVASFPVVEEHVTPGIAVVAISGRPGV